jgi:hypothetical protein
MKPVRVVFYLGNARNGKRIREVLILSSNGYIAVITKPISTLNIVFDTDIGCNLPEFVFNILDSVVIYEEHDMHGKPISRVAKASSYHPGIRCFEICNGNGCIKLDNVMAMNRFIRSFHDYAANLQNRNNQKNDEMNKFKNWKDAVVDTNKLKLKYESKLKKYKKMKESLAFCQSMLAKHDPNIIHLMHDHDMDE